LKIDIILNYLFIPNKWTRSIRFRGEKDSSPWRRK